tara:strand:- start:3331 stop:3528 length:198 start_codon:yes stop_codon:yes gene_type:complete
MSAASNYERVANKYTRKGSRQVWYSLGIFSNNNPSKPIQLAKKGDTNYTIDVSIDDFSNNFVTVD